MAVAGRSAHTHWRKSGCGEADTQPRRSTTINPLFNMPDIETDESLPVLCVCHTLQSCSEVSEHAQAKW